MVFTLVNLFAATNKIDLQNITQILFKVLFNTYLTYTCICQQNMQSSHR